MKNIAIKREMLILSIINLLIIIPLLIGVRYFESFKLTFVIPYILCFVPVSYISGKILLENLSFTPKNLKRDAAIIIISSAILYALTVFFSGITLGSIYITPVIGAFSGYVTFILLKNKTITKETNADIAENPYKYLFLIFLLAFILRALVFGLPPVPLGYDTPVYLIQAIEGSQLSAQEMLSETFRISTNVYKDTWRFSKVWLGLAYRALSFFGLEPEYIARVVIPLISALAVIPLFLLARELTHNNKIALYSALVFALMPSELVFSDLYKEILGEFFLILSLFLLLKFLRNSTYSTLALLFISLFLLWKSAVTAFAKFVLFASAIFLYHMLESNFKISKNTFTVLILGFASFILLQERLLTTFPSLSPVHVVEDIYLSQRFSFTLISIIDLIPFVIFVLYLTRIYCSEEISKAEKSIFSTSLAIFIALFFYSFVIAGLGGYRIFPSTSFLNALRFSLYLGIPFSLVGGLFLYSISKFRKSAVFILLTLGVTFALTGNINTTPAPGHITTTISKEVYEQLDSLNYSAYDGVIALGEFEHRFNTKDFSFGNWVKYLVLKNSGKMPILIENLTELNNLDLENKNYLFLNLSNKTINDIAPLEEYKL